VLRRAILSRDIKVTQGEEPIECLEATPPEIQICQDEKGREPFGLWLDTLKDAKTEAVILKRIERIAGGNFGDVEPIGEGVSELRIDFGPGYRVYFGQIGKEVHIISGGNKKTQQSDIKAAKEYWSNYAGKK
jgi:putative addiction module killer protein